MPPVTLVAGERDGSRVVAAASNATAANVEIIRRFMGTSIDLPTGASAALRRGSITVQSRDAELLEVAVSLWTGALWVLVGSAWTFGPARPCLGDHPSVPYFRCGRINQPIPHPAPADSDRSPAWSHQPGT